MPVHAGSGIEPGGHGNWAQARGLRRHVGGVCGLHAAQHHPHGGVRPWGGSAGRHLGCRLARGPEGYGAAQAVPGPLFTFASFLGASAQGVNWLWGATIATVAIFLPAALLVVGVMPFWDRLRANPKAASALAGANAAVVGILAAALYNPVFTAGIHGPATMAVAAAAFAALHNFKAPAWAVVPLAAVVGWVAL